MIELRWQPLQWQISLDWTGEHCMAEPDDALARAKVQDNTLNRRAFDGNDIPIPAVLHAYASNA